MHLLKHRRVVANMIKRMSQQIHFRDSKISNKKKEPIHVGFSQYQSTRQQQEWQREPTPVGSTSHQQVRYQNRHYQNGAGLPYNNNNNNLFSLYGLQFRDDFVQRLRCLKLLFTT